MEYPWGKEIQFFVDKVSGIAKTILEVKTGERYRPHGPLVVNV